MMEFQPSTHSYGEASDASGIDSGYSLDEIASAASAALFGQGAREEAGEIRARIENYRQYYEGASSSFMKNLWASRINVLQGKLSALEEEAGEERAAVVTTQMGKVGLATLLIGGALAVGTLSWYFVQKAQTEKWKRRQATR